MRVFHKLMDYHLNEAEEGRAKESLMVLRDMVGEQVRSKPRYRCQKCGFTAIRCTGTVHPAAPGQPLSLFAASTGSNF
jgi:lipopolysaccharide biosynthesis regulator YciM